MHDLIYDFVQFVSRSNAVILDNIYRSDISKVRHLNLMRGWEMMSMTLGDVAQLHPWFSKHCFLRGMFGNFRRSLGSWYLQCLLILKNFHCASPT